MFLLIFTVAALSILAETNTGTHCPMQSATSPWSSPPTKALPAQIPPGSPLPSSEQATSPSSRPSPATSPNLPTPSPFPLLCQAYPTSPMASKTTEVIQSTLRKGHFDSIVLRNQKRRVNSFDVHSFDPDFWVHKHPSADCRLLGSRSHLSPPSQLLRQRSSKLLGRGHRNIPSTQVNISTRSSTATTYYSNTINYTAQSAGMTFRKFTTPLSSNYIVLFITSLWTRGYSSYVY